MLFSAHKEGTSVFERHDDNTNWSSIGWDTQPRQDSRACARFVILVPQNTLRRRLCPKHRAKRGAKPFFAHCDSNKASCSPRPALAHRYACEDEKRNRSRLQIRLYTQSRLAEGAFVTDQVGVCALVCDVLPLSWSLASNGQIPQRIHGSVSRA